MFALLALICFILALFAASFPVDLLTLGWVFVAAHLLIGLWPLPGAATPPWRRG
jgi:hypothetical protein